MAVCTQDLKRTGAMHLNSTHLVRGPKRTLLEKAHIWEADLPSPVSDPGAAAVECMTIDCNARTCDSRS